MIEVKICGVRDALTASAAAAAGADWIGLVFHEASHRAVTLDEARAISGQGGCARVGLFVDATDDRIEAAIEAGRLSLLQLHGSETPERCAAVRTRFALPVMKAQAVGSAADLDAASRFVGAADRLLLDAKPPPGGLPGGNAQAFDWTLLAGHAMPLPWMLAGGLDPANVAQAVALSGAASVDVSSGVERSRGVKDPALIAAFVSAARSEPQPIVRLATEADCPGIGSVHVACWRETYRGTVPDPVLAGLNPAERASLWRRTLASGHALLVAESGGTIWGFGAAGPQREDGRRHPGEIWTIYVLGRAQRRGVGRALMAEMARRLLARGLRSADLWSMTQNLAAAAFYQALGGIPFERRETAEPGWTLDETAFAFDDLEALARAG